MRYKNLEEVVDQLYSASKKHAGQAKKLEKHLKSIKSSPTKDGSLEDFQKGVKGHNPDTMSAKHEDFHLKQSGESPNKKQKGGGTRKTCLPAAKIASMSKSERQRLVSAKQKSGRAGKYKRSSKTNVKGARKKGATLRDWFEKEDWRQVNNPSKKCGEK